MSIILATSIGELTIDLFVKEAPIACENFLKLCKLKYYHFSPFHSLQKNHSIQSGDPLAGHRTSTGGTSIQALLHHPYDISSPIPPAATTFIPEFHPSLSHVTRGTVSLVTAPTEHNADKRLAGSQFIITMGNDLHDSLDGQAAVIGEVVEGLDLLDKFNATITDETGWPLRDIRIKHTIILDDPFDDPDGLLHSAEPPASPLQMSSAQRETVRIADDEDLVEEVDPVLAAKRQREKEAKAQALTLEMVGDLPYAEVKPPQNVLFVCKLNPVTQDEDLNLIFSRFGEIESCEIIRDTKTGDSLQYAFIEFSEQKSCEQAYEKMQSVLIDDHRIHVDFSQSVSKLSGVWRDGENAKRRKHVAAGGWGGVEGLEKKRQYRDDDERYSVVAGNGESGGRNMVFEKREKRRTKTKSRSRSRSPARYKSSRKRPRSRSRSRSKSRERYRRRDADDHHRRRR